MTRVPIILSWCCQIVAAAILGQTLFFKFTGAEESIYIFRTLGMEPWGRIGSGVFELLAAVLLLIPRLSATGALLALGLMAGAILAHLGPLGLEVRGDGGLLFGLAVVTFVCSAVVAFVHRREIPLLGRVADLAS
jgi:hypothetical protein